MANNTTDPKTFILETLEKQLKVPTETEEAVAFLLDKIETDGRIQFLGEAIDTFKSVIQKLIVKYPRRGYEQWQPPTGRKTNGGPRWAESVERLETYWDKHYCSKSSP